MTDFEKLEREYLQVRAAMERQQAELYQMLISCGDELAHMRTPDTIRNWHTVRQLLTEVQRDLQTLNNQ